MSAECQFKVSFFFFSSHYEKKRDFQQVSKERKKKKKAHSLCVLQRGAKKESLAKCKKACVLIGRLKS